MFGWQVAEGSWQSTENGNWAIGRLGDWEGIVVAGSWQRAAGSERTSRLIDESTSRPGKRCGQRVEPVAWSASQRNEPANVERAGISRGTIPPSRPRFPCPPGPLGGVRVPLRRAEDVHGDFSDAGRPRVGGEERFDSLHGVGRERLLAALAADKSRHFFNGKERPLDCRREGDVRGLFRTTADRALSRREWTSFDIACPPA